MAIKIVPKQYMSNTTEFPRFTAKLRTAFEGAGWAVSITSDTSSLLDMDVVSSQTIDGDAIKCRVYMTYNSTCALYTYGANGTTILGNFTFRSSSSYISDMSAIIHPDQFIILGHGGSSSTRYSTFGAAGDLINWTETLGYTGADNLAVFGMTDTSGGYEFRKAKTLDTSGLEATNQDVDPITNYAYSYAMQTGIKKEQLCDMQVRFSDGSVGIGGEFRTDMLIKSTRSSSETIKEIEVIQNGADVFMHFKRDNYSLMCPYVETV